MRVFFNFERQVMQRLRQGALITKSAWNVIDGLGGFYEILNDQDEILEGSDEETPQKYTLLWQTILYETVHVHSSHIFS